MVLLINLPAPFLVEQRVHPPLGLLYLGAVLQENKVEVEVVDLAGQSCEDLLVYNTPELVGISSVTPQFDDAKVVLDRLREQCPDVPVVIGGPHATVDPKSCGVFDYIAVGEGEQVIADYKKWGEAKVIQYTSAGDLDSIPFPARDLVDLGSYSYDIGGEPATTLVTSRGCPYRCAFCCRTCGPRMRMRSPENIIEEVRLLKRKYGYRAFAIFDDVFVLNRKRISRITSLLKKENVIYRCFVRSDVVDLSLLRMLKESGCYEVGFGAESGSQKILDVVDKRTSVQQNTRLVEMCKQVSLKVKAFMIVGLPGETHETMQETYNWLRDVAPDTWDVSIYTPYKGSRIVSSPFLYDIKINNIAFKDAWHKGVPGAYKCAVSTSGLSSDDIVQWRDKIEAELGGNRYKHPVSDVLHSLSTGPIS